MFERLVQLVMNFLEVAYDIFKPFVTGDKKALNILEVANLWLILSLSNNALRVEELAINTVQDDELKQKLKDAKKIHASILEEVGELLKNEGVTLPDNTPEKPEADLTNIPDGAKMNDEEIANMLSFNLITGVSYSSRGMNESNRADVGLIFFKIIVKKTALNLSLKQLMEKRSWIHTPPNYKS